MRFNKDKEGKNKQSNPIKLGLRPNIQQVKTSISLNFLLHCARSKYKQEHKYPEIQTAIDKGLTVNI